MLFFSCSLQPFTFPRSGLHLNNYSGSVSEAPAYAKAAQKRWAGGGIAAAIEELKRSVSNQQTTFRIAAGNVLVVPMTVEKGYWLNHLVKTVIVLNRFTEER